MFAVALIVAPETACAALAPISFVQNGSSILFAAALGFSAVLVTNIRKLQAQRDRLS